MDSPHPESTPGPDRHPTPPSNPAVGTTLLYRTTRQGPTTEPCGCFHPLGVHGHDASERVSNFEQISFRRLCSIPSGYREFVHGSATVLSESICRPITGPIR